jgi:hypothetical protein
MPRSISRMMILGGLLALAAAAGGCQRGPTWNLAPVEGTVTKGGRPLRGIEVVFLADSDAGTLGPRATGRTDEAGHYRLRTDSGEDGVAAGKHRVVLFDLEAANKQLGRSFREKQRKEAARLSPEMAKRLEEELKKSADALRLPPSYGRINKTPLRAEVGHEPLMFNIIIP